MTSRINRRHLAKALSTAVVVTTLPLHPSTAQARLSIAASMPLLQDIVANIAGDAADVFSIMPANADPHTWEAKPDDMVRVTEAAAFIFFGADLEPFVETGGWRGAVQDNGISELAVADHVTLIVNDADHDHEEHDDNHDHHAGDPHIWLDPLTIVEAVPAIADFLTTLQPDLAATFASNADDYVARLTETHQSLADAFGSIPEDRRKLLVFHDAWTYFAARYDFEIIGIVLENPDSEVSAQELLGLLDVVDESGIDVIFAEPQFNTSVLDVIQQEGDIRIATLLTDSFAENVDTYIGLLEFNRDQIVTYLGS